MTRRNWLKSLAAGLAALWGVEAGENGTAPAPPAGPGWEPCGDCQLVFTGTTCVHGQEPIRTHYVVCLPPGVKVVTRELPPGDG